MDSGDALADIGAAGASLVSFSKRDLSCGGKGNEHFGELGAVGAGDLCDAVDIIFSRAFLDSSLQSSAPKLVKLHLELVKLLEHVLLGLVSLWVYPKFSRLLPELRMQKHIQAHGP